ncbi:hypothetical protein COOONC_22272 [Cooperia oncophora]
MQLTFRLSKLQLKLFFTMMSAFMVITICYGAFNVFICMLQEIRRGKTTKCNTWAPIIVMMAITQGVLITIYKFHYLSESMILFLVVYYVAVSVIMAVVVAVFLHRPRPNDNTWVKRRQPMKSKFSRFLLFCLIAVLPSMLHTHHLSAKLMDWYFGGVEVLTAIYTFTDYMLHPWIFNIAGMLLLEPFRKVFTGNMRPFSWRSNCLIFYAAHHKQSQLSIESHLQVTTTPHRGRNHQGLRRCTSAFGNQLACTIHLLDYLLSSY